MKKMVIIWIIIAVMLVGTLTFVGLEFQNSIKEYRSYESDVVESAQIYMELNDVKLDASKTLKLDLNKLIEDKYLSTNMVGEDTCEGYVIIEKTFKGIEYYPYIKCEEYTTVDYE